MGPCDETVILCSFKKHLNLNIKFFTLNEAAMLPINLSSHLVKGEKCKMKEMKYTILNYVCDNFCDSILLRFRYGSGTVPDPIPVPEP